MVYGWGHNKYGQTGCVNEEIEIDQDENTDKSILTPTQLKGFDSNIKSIYCSSNQSFALTTDGRVYSWGYNNWCQLGHDLCPKNAKLFEPTLISNISVVKSIGLSNKNTYFLTNEGLIYFCGKIFGENDSQSYQKVPKLFESKRRFSSLQSITCYHKNQLISNRCL